MSAKTTIYKCIITRTTTNGHRQRGMDSMIMRHDDKGTTPLIIQQL